MSVRKIRIAMVEDSQTIRFYYRKLFEGAGFEVLGAEDARQGWGVICSHKPDIIVLDMMMPGIPGIELLKRIRAFDSTRNIPVLVLTALKDPEQVKEIMQAGASHYAQKGADTPDTIKQTVNTLLKNEQQRQLMEKLRMEGEPKKADVPDHEKEFFWF